ncbi:uncharacterized protein LOC111887270 [Lactuca sativa]|uniref:uncharacterized protein LOC111887270 n=1 Tax=Lactuca sativa TaxID=4236 RepID=UPI000CD93627|nr:uncharacterized protein LOC111887270 [Lactuca sativa]
MDEFREELLKRNEGSVVEIDFEKFGVKKLFKRIFICLAACSRGFVVGCRSCIGLDACHLKGKFNGVLAAATGIDGNNSIFPIAYYVLESENTQSWTWFLDSLKKSIGTPNGLVISSDMQKGLEVAIMNVYPNVEPGTYIATSRNTFLVTSLTPNYGLLRKPIVQPSMIETFNSWIGKLCYKPVFDLLDAIREKIMKQFDKKRNLVNTWNGVLVLIAKNHLNDIAKNLGEYEVTRSCENQVEVKYKGTRWEVNLDERKCSCQVWQVQGRPCVHATAFISLIRDANWDKYVDPYFTIEKFKSAYAFQIAPMPGQDLWAKKNGGKIYPPIIKRPPG